MSGFRKFDLQSKCPKCGVQGAQSEYKRLPDSERARKFGVNDIHGMLQLEIDRLPDEAVDEVLVRSCGNCGYTWKEVPLDVWDREWKGDMYKTEQVLPDDVKKNPEIKTDDIETAFGSGDTMPVNVEKELEKETEEAKTPTKPEVVKAPGAEKMTASAVERLKQQTEIPTKDLQDSMR